jgi:hypothetical protein
MARMKDLAIDLATLTARDLADAAGVMRAGGVDPATVDLAAAQADPAGAPVPVLAALIYCALRRDSPRITPARCVRLAAAVAGLDVPRGG